MKKLFTIAILILSTIWFSGCCTLTCAPETSTDLEQLADWMTGFFSSLEQSQNDPQFFDIHLHMTRIWNNQKDGYWIYVEQAVAGKDPYRQRVYHLTEPMPGRFISKVYEIENPEAFAGAWGNANFAINLSSPEDLIERPGCTIYLIKESDGNYRGSTHEADCKSSLRGAAYATSQVRVMADKLISWDRGYDANDKQVWGAIKSGYIFDKLENYGI